MLPLQAGLEINPSGPPRLFRGVKLNNINYEKLHLKRITAISIDYGKSQKKRLSDIATGKPVRMRKKYKYMTIGCVCWKEKNNYCYENTAHKKTHPLFLFILSSSDFRIPLCPPRMTVVSLLSLHMFRIV